ncbi:MAG: MaoC family dehydratase N-terminal domain-containing protein [Mycobacterium sp.]
MAIRRFPVEAGHVLTFARAIGDATYSDEEFERTGLADVVVPPTFVQSSAQFDPDYPLRPHTGKPWLTDVSVKPAQDDQGNSADGAAPKSESVPRGPVLHAEQRFEFARPVRVGDALTATQRPGRQWDKQGRNGGQLYFTETVTEFYDQDGELAVTATAVAVRVDQPRASVGDSK